MDLSAWWSQYYCEHGVSSRNSLSYVQARRLSYWGSSVKQFFSPFGTMELCLEILSWQCESFPSDFHHPVMCAGHLMDFSRHISKVQSFGTLLASANNAARTTLCTTASEGTDEAVVRSQPWYVCQIWALRVKARSAQAVVKANLGNHPLLAPALVIIGRCSYLAIIDYMKDNKNYIWSYDEERMKKSQMR